MPRPRTGSISPTSDGRHRARITVRGKDIHIGYYTTPEEAVQANAAALASLDDADYDEDTPLADYCEKWLTVRELNKIVADPDSDWSRFRCHIKDDPIGKIGIRSIRRGDVKDWVLRTRGKIAAQTTRNALNIIRGALDKAIDDEIIRANPAVDVSVPEDRNTEESWTYLIPDEQTALIEAINGPEKWIAAFAIGSGLRAGELIALHAADVRDSHIVVRFGGKNTTTKNGKIRQVPLFGIAKVALENWRKVARDYIRRNPHGLMFPGRNGAFRSKEHVLPWHILHGRAKPRVVGAYERAGIDRHVRWHDLRHTCASSLVSGWWGRRWSLEEVCAMLGHSDIKVTQRYAHLADTALKQAARETDLSPTWTDRLNRAQRADITSVPPARIELATNGLGSPGYLDNIHAVSPSRSATGRQSMATKLLAAAARGDGTTLNRLAIELAAGLLDLDNDGKAETG